jgi:lysophospholipase L1-like esterase
MFLILSVLLFISLVANLIIFRSAWLYYKEANAVRLNPLGLSFYPTAETQPVEKEPAQKVVVFFGDSRADQWPFPQGPEMDARFVFVNRGVHTQTASQVAGRFDAHIRPLQPDILILQMCINDLKTIPLFPDAREPIIDGCKANIAEIVAKSRALGTAVILTTVFPFGPLPPERRLLWTDDTFTAVEEVNTYIHSLSGEGVLILDATPILADETGRVKEPYRFDLLHINTAGYDALNQELAKILVMVE